MKVQEKSALFAGIAYLVMAVAHIPDKLFRHAFDKDAPVQLFMLLVIAAALSIVIAFRSHRFRFARFPLYSVGALVIVEFASLLMSGSLTSSLIGDAGRFVGVVSVLGLIAVSVFHTQFKLEAFLYLLKYYLFAVQIVVILGLSQHFNLIEFPGDQGVASTLGNTDFFAAYVATSLPLLLLFFMRSARKVQILIGVIALIDIYALHLAGPLQGYLDIAFLVVGILIYVVRKYIPRRELSLNVRTFLGVFGIVIWAEFIFLMPFLGKMIPVLGNDVQVQIRANFWLAGMREFFAHPLLGVGPDQYGNFYEQYRTVEDIQKYTNILSNDAHSASVQTLATLGILGIAAFIALITLVVRSWLVMWDKKVIERKYLYVFALYIFIYLTNSFVSPFTLTHKFIFWAICGFLVGQVYRAKSHKTYASAKVKSSALSGAIVLISIAALFAQAQVTFLTHLEDFANKKPVSLDYQHSALLPCFMYFDAEFLIATQQSPDIALKLAQDMVAINPRCARANLAITETVVNSGDLKKLGPLVYKLYREAPARSATLGFAMYYANRTNDVALKKSVEKTMKILGLVYVPGKLG